MFGIFDSKKCVEVLREQVVKESRLGGCKIQKSYGADEASVSSLKLNEYLSELLGRDGEFALSYTKEKTLEFQMFFAYTEGYGEYEIICEMFEDLDEDDYAYDDVVLNNCTDADGTELIFKAYNVEFKNLGERADLLLSRAFNFLDVFGEELEDEF